MDEYMDVFGEAVELVEVVGQKLRSQAQEWQVEEGEAFGLIFERSLRLLRANKPMSDTEEARGMLQELYRQQHQILYQLTSSMSDREKLRAAMVVNTCGLILLSRVFMVDADKMMAMIFAAVDDAHIADGMLDPQSKFNTGVAP